jgi:predicted RNA-binding protein with PIN domain
MAYLIDGHNLIPKVPGISLQDIDDELKLIEWLQRFSRLRRKQVEVYFDLAPAGFSSQRSYGQVKAHFVRQGTTADQAIQARLTRMGKAARNIIVVSSDRQVQASARAAQAHFISSEAFAFELLNLPEEKSNRPQEEPSLTEQEVADWEELFRKRPGNAPRTPGAK